MSIYRKATPVNLELTKAIERRRKNVKSSIAHLNILFQDRERKSNDLVDAFHGEMHYGPDADAVKNLNKAWAEVTSEKQEAYIKHNKKQPEVIQNLATERLFDRLTHPQIEGVSGIEIDPQEVVVVPYSSTRLLIEALGCRPLKNRSIALCPEGFYKGNARLANNCGLAIETFPVDLKNDGIIIPEKLDQYLTYKRNRVSVLWLTMPGNPLIAHHSVEQLEQVAQVIFKHDVDVFIDMLFDKMVPDGKYTPLTNIRVKDHNGQSHLMYDRCLVVVGNSKGFNATGPWKMGAAISGNETWLSAVREQSKAVTFQRETTHLIYAGTSNTSNAYIRRNQEDMMKNQERVDALIGQINSELGKEAIISYGYPKYGPFRGIGLQSELLEKANIEDSWQLADFLLAAAGIESVEFVIVGIKSIGVRINVACPRVRGNKSQDNLLMLFGRLKSLIEAIEDGLTYKSALDNLKIKRKVSLANFILRQKHILRNTKAC